MDRGNRTAPGAVSKQIKNSSGGKSVVVLKRSDVTIRNENVYMPNTIEMAQLKKPGKGQFGRQVPIDSGMTVEDIEILLKECFPCLEEQRFYCAAAVNNRTKLDFYGIPRIWDGSFIKKKIKGNSALYIFAEGSGHSQNFGSHFLEQAALTGPHSQGVRQESEETGQPIRTGENVTNISNQSLELENQSHPSASSVSGFLSNNFVCHSSIALAMVTEANQAYLHPVEMHSSPQEENPLNDSLDSLFQDLQDLANIPSFGTSSASEVDSGWQDDGDGLASDIVPVSPDLDNIPIPELFNGDENLTSILVDVVDGQSPMDIQPVVQSHTYPSGTVETNHSARSESPSVHGSDLSTVHRDGDHSEVSRPDQGISPLEGQTEGGYPFFIFLPEPLPEDVTSGMAEFRHLATCTANLTDLTKKYPNVFQGIVPESAHPGDVQVTVMTQTGQHLAIRPFKYIDKEEWMAVEILSGGAKLSKVFSIMGGKFNKLLDCSNQTKQQHSLQFLQLLVYTAAQTGEKQFIEIIFSTSAGQIVFDSYKDRAQLPEDVARANGHDDLANYLQDFTTRLSKKPEFSLEEAHVIDWSELERAATAAQTQRCLTEEISSDDSSENNSDTDYFADVETSIDSSELSRSTSEDDTSEPYFREKTKASAHQSIFSIVKGAFAENGTMDKIRQNILEGVKQKHTVLILEDSHFDSRLPEAVKGLNYTLAFQLAAGSKNIPRHLHTANERFLASRENIIRQPTISFCKLHPDVLIESSFVKNNNDYILRIDASKQSNQLNKVKQFGGLTHCDLWLFTSAFRPTRKTLFVYFADRKDALPHSYFFEDEDCESQIRCWKWRRSENNSWKFTERLEAEKPPPGREKSQMESHADLPVTYIVRDKQALRLSWMHAMMHHCWTIKSTKKTSNITIFVASLGNDGILEDTCGPELGIALAKVKSLTTLHFTINNNGGILERTWETYLYSSLAEIKSLTTLHLTINSNDGIDGWRWAHELGYGLAKIKSLTTLHLTTNSNDGIGGCRWAHELGYGLAKVKSLTTLHLTINSNDGIDGCMWTEVLGYGLAEIKSLTTLHLTINSNDGIDGCRWAEKLGYGLAKVKSLTTLHLTINSNDGILERTWETYLYSSLAEIKSLTTLHLTINSNDSIDEWRWAHELGYGLAKVKSLTTLHLTINSKYGIHGCRWAEKLGYGLAEIKSLTTLHLTINSYDGIDGCRWAEKLGYGLAKVKSLTTLHLTINSNYGIHGRRWAEKLGYGLAKIKSLTTLHLTINSNDGIHGWRWAEKLGYGLAKIKSLTTLHLTINSNDGIDGCRWAEALGSSLAQIKSLTTLHLKINGNDDIFKGRVTDVDLAHGCFKRVFSHRLRYGLAESKSLTEVCLKANNRSSSLDELMPPYPSNFDGSWINLSGYQKTPKNALHPIKYTSLPQPKPMHDLSGMSYYKRLEF
ncbi:uncharacterized protein [Montipora capricornis]|uniref:uncharacterized protein n=1 Tax=Montipora capricornis TaxID=246305 RepID=UPI0035F21673